MGTRGWYMMNTNLKPECRESSKQTMSGKFVSFHNFSVSKHSASH
jgi:hypothetical protein